MVRKKQKAHSDVHIDGYHTCFPPTRNVHDIYRFSLHIPKQSSTKGDTAISDQIQTHQTDTMGRSSVASKIDPLYLALLHQRHHDYEKCADVCTKVS